MLHRRLKSFKYAAEGFKTLLKDEPNARIHLVATVVVVATGVYFQINSIEWVAILFSIAFVWVTESINTAIENLCDKVSPEQNNRIKKIKDVAAFAVLVAAIISVGVGLVVFYPYFQAI